MSGARDPPLRKCVWANFMPFPQVLGRSLEPGDSSCPSPGQELLGDDPGHVYRRSMGSPHPQEPPEVFSQSLRSYTGSKQGHSSWTGSSRVCNSWTGSSKRGHSSWTGSSKVCSSWTGSPHTSHSPPWSPHMSHSPPWSPHRSHSPLCHSWSRSRLAHSSTRACSSRWAHSSWSRSLRNSQSSPWFWWVEGGVGQRSRWRERKCSVWGLWGQEPLYTCQDRWIIC